MYILGMDVIATLVLGSDDIHSCFILLISHIMLFTSLEDILLKTTTRLVGARFVITLWYYLSLVHIVDITVVIVSLFIACLCWISVLDTSPFGREPVTTDKLPFVYNF